MLLEFQLDWIKIVDLLLVTKFWACLLFFTHPQLTFMKLGPQGPLQALVIIQSYQNWRHRMKHFGI